MNDRGKVRQWRPSTPRGDAGPALVRRLASLPPEELKRYIGGLAAEKRRSDQQFRKKVSDLSRQLRTLDAAGRNVVLQTILPALSVEDVTEVLVKAAGGHALPASFRACITTRSKMRVLGKGYTPEWQLYDKPLGYTFMDELGVRRPKTHCTGLPLSQLRLIPGTVVKPVSGAGSRGVFLVVTDDRIIDVRGEQTLQSWSALCATARKYLKTRWVKQDEWLVEELIPDDTDQGVAARDLKFYCFYGRVGLVLEVRRYPVVSYCWWSPEGEPVRTGKYDSQLHVGTGFQPQDVKFAEAISSEVPAPFIRVDCLASHDGVVFGEFTPRPGSYDAFDAETDRRLGDSFLDAEGRLVADLIAGKRFARYLKCVEQA